MGPAVEPGVRGGRFDTVGHEDALASVARAVRSGRPPHALLLVGPRGVGKTTLALDLAAGLLCLAPDAVDRPCRACAACRKVAAGNHADLHRIEPEGVGEQVRLVQVQQLAADLALTAMEGRYRVAVISAAHRLNADAQNALLKTLEEPGPATCLVLCADDVAPLLPTVLSRVGRLRLAPLGIELLTDWLVTGGHADPTVARAAAVAAAGRPGIALALAHQPKAVLARAGIGRTLLASLDTDRRSRLGAATGLIADGVVVDAALRGEVPPASTRLQPVERRRGLAVVIDAWREVGRDLAVAAQADPPGPGVRDRDRLPELRALVSRVDGASLRRFLDRLDRLQVAVEAYASPELVLDVLLLAWPGVLQATARPLRERAA